jgi:hypothetical protein
VAAGSTSGPPARRLQPRPGGAAHVHCAGRGVLIYRNRERKRWSQFLDFLKVLHRRWPDRRLYLVLDNYGPHQRPEVRAWCATHEVELVFLPTNASSCLTGK